MPKPFPLISGRLSLDLVNTEVVRRGVRHDLLATPSDLQHWITIMQDTGALRGVAMDAEEAADAWPFIRALRSVLRQGFEQIAGAQPLESDWPRHLEEVIQQAPLAYKLGLGRLIPVPMGQPADAVGSLVAYDALQLLASNVLYDLHHCANPECVLLFLDEQGRRKWCSMKLCGNRAKVSRYQSRHGTP